MFAANSADGVQIYDPAAGYLGIAPVNDPAVQIATTKNDDFDPIWTTTPNSRFVARRGIGRMGRGQCRWLVQRDDGPPAGLPTDRARATRWSGRP